MQQKYEPERRIQKHLIQLARAWCEATGNPIVGAGRLAVKDSRFFPHLIERYEAGYRQEDDTIGTRDVAALLAMLSRGFMIPQIGRMAK